MINVYFDCEFTELSRQGQLISIGFTDDHKHQFYAEFNDFDKDNLNEFIKSNVIPALRYDINTTDEKLEVYSNEGVHNILMKGNKNQIRDKLNEWFKELILYNYETNGNEDQIQFYTDCYAYDWMLFSELMWGNGFDVPSTFSYIPIDLSTVLWTAGIDPDINREQFLFEDNAEVETPKKFKHNAFWDALIIKHCFDELISKHFPNIIHDETKKNKAATDFLNAIGEDGFMSTMFPKWYRD